MDYQVWWRVGAAAILLTIGIYRIDGAEQMIFSALGFVVWGWWSITALDVVFYTDSGVSRAASYPGLAVFGAVLGVLCLIPMVNAMLMAMGETTVTERVDSLPGFGGGMR